MNNPQDKNQEELNKPKKTGENTERDERGRWKEGVSGNPNGKPEGAYSLLAILRAELRKCPEGQNKKTYADLIIKRMLKEAIEGGDIQQIKLIWNYIEGMPRENHDITSGGNPLQIYAGLSLKTIKE